MTAKIVPARWDEGSFVGGALCLDFTNTVGGSFKERRENRLRSYADLLAWGRCVGAIDEDDLSRLARRAERASEVAARVLAQAVELREALYRLFSATAADLAPDESDLSRLNKALGRILRGGAITPSDDGFAWIWSGAPDDLDRPLWPVLRSAAELLTGSELALLRECGRCSWLFLDRSKNRRRRWCRMELCGNRAKSQRRYRRATGQLGLG